MPRKLAFFIFIFLLLDVFAQNSTSSNKLKSYRTFYSNLYFDLMEVNIPKSDLQNLMILESNFGDNQLTKQLIIYNFLFPKDLQIEENSCEKDHIIEDIIEEKNLLFPPKNKGLRVALLDLLRFYIGNQILESNCRPEEFIACSTEKLIALKKQNKEVAEIIINDVEPQCEKIIEAYQNNKEFVVFLSEYYTQAFLKYEKKGITNQQFFENFEASINTISPIYKYIFFCKENCFESNQRLTFELRLKKEIDEIFQHLFKRDATQDEKDFYQQILLKEPDGLKIVYYLLLTSDEYLYY